MIKDYRDRSHKWTLKKFYFPTTYSSDTVITSSDTVSCTDSISSSLNNYDYLVFCTDIWTSIVGPPWLYKSSSNSKIRNLLSKHFILMKDPFHLISKKENYSNENYENNNNSDENNNNSDENNNNSEKKNSVNLRNESPVDDPTSHDNGIRSSDPSSSGDGTSPVNIVPVNIVSNKELYENNSPAALLAKFAHLWFFCDNCYTENYREFLKEKMNICEYCDFNLQMDSSHRIDLLIDPGTWDPMDEHMISIDPFEILGNENKEICNKEMRAEFRAIKGYWKQYPFRDEKMEDGFFSLEKYMKSMEAYLEQYPYSMKDIEGKYFSLEVYILKFPYIPKNEKYDEELVEEYPFLKEIFLDLKIQMEALDEEETDQEEEETDQEEEEEETIKDDKEETDQDQEEEIIKDDKEETDKDQEEETIKDDDDKEETDQDQEEEETIKDDKEETDPYADFIPIDKDKPYMDRVDSYQRETGLTEAIQIGIGQLHGIPVAIAVMDFKFIAGSMGSVVGEKITRLIEYATNRSLPLIISCASGGARMQEGSLSLMQMAKISSVLLEYQLTKKLFLVSLFTSPTTGGVTASFGMLGNVIIAEPDTTIAFAGKRVIEETLNITVPEGVQEAEYLFEKGSLDSIVPRHFLKGVLSELLQFHGFFPLNKNFE